MERGKGMSEKRRVFEVISVEDELPKESGYYFVFVSKIEQGKLRQTGLCEGAYYSVKTDRTGEDKWTFTHEFPYLVTHWLKEVQA